MCINRAIRLKRIVFTGLLPILSLSIRAGWATSYNQQIQSIKVEVNEDWLKPPFITLGSDDYVTLSFDEMSHDFHRYTYSIIHCDAHWNPSDLFESDYLDGFNGQPIEDYQTSMGTTFEYTHYKITLPNENVSPRISGNYIIVISEDGKKIADARFGVIEPLAQIGVTINTNTDIDNNDKHQQLELSISYPGLQVRDPKKELTEVVIQNGRIDEMVTNLIPSRLMNGQIQFVHDRNLIFTGGGEFRRFEIINMYSYLQHVDKIDMYEPYFHATLLKDSRITSYLYDKDHNGRYLIRNSETDDSDTEADYLFVHFSYSSERLNGGTLYLSGDFTQRELSEKWEMTYNSTSRAYELTALLKQGSYDYQYLWKPDNSKIAQTSITEGDFYETKNEYLILLYYHPSGSRFDRLIGTQTIHSK